MPRFSIRNLNGWQRIFVVLSFGWLVYCAGFTLENWPTENTYRAIVSARALREVPNALSNAQANLDCMNRHKQDGSSISFEECNVEGITAVKPEDKQRYDALIAKGEARMEHVLLRDRAKLSGVCLGAWLGGSVAFYFAAWALFRVCRWVVQGFRKPQA